MISSLLSRAGLTLSGAAERCGVTPRTIMNWRDGKSRIPAEALAILEAAAAEAEPAPAPESQTLDERIAALRALQLEQHDRCCQLEDGLGEARRRLADTSRKLNAIYAERGRSE